MACRHPPENGYQSCERCRAYWRDYQRARYRQRPPLWPPSVSSRVRALLTTFVLTPRELSSALNIPVPHASITLIHLWQRGVVERWPYRDRSYRYRLKDTP